MRLYNNNVGQEYEYIAVFDIYASNAPQFY